MLPKAELHCHIEGTASPNFVLSQAKKYGVDASQYVHPENGYIWNSFTEFLNAYDFAASLVRTPEDYIELTSTYYLDLAEQGCIYAEQFVSPEHATRIGCSYSVLIEAITEGMMQVKAQTGIEGRITIVGVRHVGHEAVEKAAQLASQFPHPFVTGFGMAGDERVGHCSEFEKAFEIAADAGLCLTSHAGEFCGPQTIIDSLDFLKVKRIGHGVRASESTDLIKRLVDESITLEVCAGSNIALGVYKDIETHPLRELWKAGCMITLNSDDPPHFHTDLKNEYEMASKIGFSNSDLLQCTINAINAAFVDEDTKNKLLAKCTLEQSNPIALG